MTSEEKCLDALREAARRLGESPTKAASEDLAITPASATIVRTLGGWNDAKEAAGLSTNSSTGSRVGPPPEDVSEQIQERWSELSVDQRWHYRNREWNTERTRRRRAERREWVAEEKAAAGCRSCGESDSRCLDFHHPDSEAKTASISQLVVEGVSNERLRAEIESCVVLCANCHREEHAGSPEPTVQITLEDGSLEPVGERESDEFDNLTFRDRCRKWVDSYKPDRGCTRCGYEPAAALDLHHVEEAEKRLAVSRLVSDAYGIDRIRRELDRCEVLCSNCHRKEHRERRT